MHMYKNAVLGEFQKGELQRPAKKPTPKAIPTNDRATLMSFLFGMSHGRSLAAQHTTVVVDLLGSFTFSEHERLSRAALLSPVFHHAQAAAM